MSTDNFEEFNDEYDPNRGDTDEDIIALLKSIEEESSIAFENEEKAKLQITDIEKLKKITNDFFSEYWKKKFGTIPEWSNKVWEFDGELPHNSYKGCYAHINKDEVVYVGLAISNSNNGSGIGSRVKNYWKKNSDKNNSLKQYMPTIEDVTGIITIPFPPNHFYLAAALEVYLIREMNPLKNRTHKKNEHS